MPSVSKKQQKFFGIVRSVQKGEQSPTTPEVAKAASSMKKGDVKKFASTKHKGLPEKKKIVEDKQIKKIIKQLRKSVKSHDKQADTLEKKVKTFKESAFTNITTGMKVGQTFQHISGATVTVDNTMSNSSDQQQTVSISGEPVPAPTGNQLGVAGVTMPLGNKKKKKKDKNVLQNSTTKTAAQINQQLDASKKASGAQTAKVTQTQNPQKFEVQGTVENVAKTLGDRIKNILRGKTFDNLFPGGTKGRRFAAEVKTFLGYLTGVNKQPITNDSISKSHLESLFRNAKLTTDNSGRVQMSDFIVGSGQKLVFTPNNPYNYGSSLDVSLKFTYDFNDNATELLKRDVDWWTRFTSDLVGSKHGYDSNALYGKLIDLAKASGRGQAVAGQFNISMNELFKLNPDLVRKHMEHNLVGKYFAKPWTVDMMRQSMATGKPVGEVPAIKAGVHAYYALTGQLPPQSVAIGSPEYYNLPPKWNYGDHPEYDPEVIANIDKLRKVAKTNAAFGKVGGGNAGSYVPPTDDVFDRDDASFKKKDYEKNRGRGYQRLAVTDPNRPARRVDPSKIVGRGYRIPRGTPRSQIVGRSYGSRGRTRRGKSDLDKAKKRLIRVLSASYSMLEESNPRIPRKKGQPANSKKHSDLYTDENPKGTIHGLGFKDVATSKASVSKIRNSSRSHAHKIQAAVAMEQRAREMGKTSEAAVYRKYINSMKKKTKKMNEAANPAQQAAIAISMKKKGIKPKSMKEEAPAKVPLKDTGNPIQNMWNKFVPPPESSNNPNVRSGKLTPGKLEAPLLNKMNTTAKNINKPIKVTSKTVKGAKSAVGGIQKGLDFVKANPGKSALIGAGVIGAGMLAKKALTRNKNKEVKEQTTFPQMQQRIRDAKERRREQQKKSEKLYIDTKRKGVKFYDKKGTGRLKDGKKIYD